MSPPIHPTTHTTDTEPHTRPPPPKLLFVWGPGDDGERKEGAGIETQRAFMFNETTTQNTFHHSPVRLKCVIKTTDADYVHERDSGVVQHAS